MLPSLQAHFDALEERRQALVAELEGCAPEQLSFRQAPEAWSLGEVAHHLLLVEQGVLQVLSDERRQHPGRRTILNRIGSVAVRVVFALGIRVKVPIRSVVPTGDVPLNEVKQQWNDTRAGIRVYLEGVASPTLRQPLLRHPVSGPMDVSQGLVFLRRHFDHHLRQVARMRRSAAFPR